MKRRTKRQAGLNQFEFSIILVVIGLIWLVALNRMHELQEMSEKTAVEMTISNIRSGLRWEMADRIMTHREASIAELEGGNPILWVEKKPETYLGELFAVPEKFPPGSWYFDIVSKELRYRPILERNLVCPQCERADGGVILDWRIEKTGNPMFGRGDTVRVVTLSAYRWF